MNEAQKIIYCIDNPIVRFDDLTNSLRWQLFPAWICGMDDYIDDILYDDDNWEGICDALGLFNENDREFVDYDTCSSEQWYEIYEIFIEHMHYFFDEWEEDNDVLPLVDIKLHFEVNATEYRRLGCLTLN